MRVASGDRSRISCDRSQVCQAPHSITATTVALTVSAYRQSCEPGTVQTGRTRAPQYGRNVPRKLRFMPYFRPDESKCPRLPQVHGTSPVELQRAGQAAECPGPALAIKLDSSPALRATRGSRRRPRGALRQRRALARAPRWPRTCRALLEAASRRHGRRVPPGVGPSAWAHPAPVLPLGIRILPHVGGRLAKVQLIEPDLSPVLEIVSVHGGSSGSGSTRCAPACRSASSARPTTTPAGPVAATRPGPSSV
jgi:hypothetical protein